MAPCSRLKSSISDQHWIIKASFLILAILGTVSFYASATSLVNVPHDHWSYEFIERLQAKGILGEFLSNSKPYSRGEVAEMILHVSRLHKDGRANLTDVDIELLKEMKREFAWELVEAGGPKCQKTGHLLDWTDGERTLVAEVGLMQNSSFSTGDDRHRTTLEVRLYGDVLNGLSFYNHSKVSYEVADDEPVAWERNDPRRVRYPWIGISDAYIVFGTPRLNIQAGKDVVLWGTGYHGVIGLSSIEPTFDIVRLRTKIWRANFTSLLGFLRDDLTREHATDVPRKYLSAHRVEIVPYPGVCVAWQEVYIYAEKLHFQLLNPIIPYQMSEDYLGGIGNNTMEGDICISLIPNTKIYTALSIDDFQTSLSPFKYPGFGWAVLGGVVIADPFGVENTDVIVEYARVDPWTYTHRGTHEDPPTPTAYKHFGEPLGHWIGPNADDVLAQVDWRFSKNIHGSIFYNRLRHGEIGGNMYDVPDYTEREKSFLEGIVESKKIIGLGLSYTTLHELEVNAEYRYIETKNRQKDKSQAWQPGWDTVESELRAVVRFRY